MRKFAFIVFACLCALGCTADRLAPESRDWRFEAGISDMRGLPSTKVSYSGAYGEHSEFETGDVFGLFVMDKSDSVIVSNLEVYCSGLDNSGATVWSIFKSGSSEDNTSNYPIADILGKGVHYFAYYPYRESLSSVRDIAGIKAIVTDAYVSLPYDQSSAYTEYDLLVASNVPDCTFGKVAVSGKTVSLTFGHTMALLRYFIPSGSVKYDYSFNGADFTPHLMGSDAGMDEFRFLFKPGCVLDVCVKYVNNNKLYKFETGCSKNIWPIATEAGHCYFLDENAPKVPYGTAVDMGTSVMWANFNIGAEDDESATAETISSLQGDHFMWGVNRTGISFGSGPYNQYNAAFTSGVKPKELPAGYDYSGDPMYDAARALWGGEWRTPTFDEWQELFDACTYKIETRKISFTSKSTGNVLVLPYQGYKNSDTVTQPDFGYYWSSSSNPDNVAKAVSTMFRNTNTAPAKHSNADRYTGLPIRAVYSK